MDYAFPQQRLQPSKLVTSKKYIALTCLNQYVGEIYSLDTESDLMQQLTDCLETVNSCSEPAWSFDNRLSYLRNDERSGIHPRGIYVFDTACIESDNCMNLQSDLIESDSNAVWSRENALILSKKGTIQFLKPEAGEFVSQDIFNTDSEGFIHIDYSPSGEYLIYTSDSDATLNLYTLSTGTLEQVFSSAKVIQMIGWILIQ